MGVDKRGRFAFVPQPTRNHSKTQQEEDWHSSNASLRLPSRDVVIMPRRNSFALRPHRTCARCSLRSCSLPELLSLARYRVDTAVSILRLLSCSLSATSPFFFSFIYGSTGMYGEGMVVAVPLTGQPGAVRLATFAVNWRSKPCPPRS